MVDIYGMIFKRGVENQCSRFIVTNIDTSQKSNITFKKMQVAKVSIQYDIIYVKI